MHEIDLEKDYAGLGVRTVPGAIARYGAYLSKKGRSNYDA
jgi:tetrahydrodipicolinate N-succinyltransferase